jgi:mannan endo-1,4-beta-mannosidase
MPKTVDYLTVHMWPDNWQRPEKSYQKEWLDAHMDVAKKTLKKPLVLEEFGKKLVAGEDNVLFEQAIDRLRNPVFDTTYQMVEEALQKGQPLQGSLFWRWDLIIYEKQPRADYGVRTYDTTFDLVRSHAKFVSELQASNPPAATCKLQCWVPADSGDRCVNRPKECSSQLKRKKKGSKPTYPTNLACCRPGMGAFQEGCKA